MWLISKNRQIATSCIPKNGSTSMRNALISDEIYQNHEVIDIPVRVAWIRNPLERLISAYSFFFYLNSMGGNGQNTPNKIMTSSWERFIDHVLTTINPHWDSQIDMLTLDGEYLPTVSHKFEGIMDKWGDYFPGLLPWQNGCNKLPVTDYKKQEIEAFYKKDFALWHSL